MKAKHFLILSILWLALIWLLSSLPAKDIPSVNIFGIDKLAHFGVYFIWGVLSSVYLYKRELSKSKIIMAYILMFALAAIDEYHQYHIPGRDVSFYDILANYLGLTASIISCYLLKARL